ncbi:hypothetical protein FS749_014377 [Ceratobasidium sp. UAMH 11750]|nr:hypothetical protein FS749_014377 [Ceratobasidium sp. UAMH 11750]
MLYLVCAPPAFAAFSSHPPSTFARYMRSSAVLACPSPPLRDVLAVPASVTSTPPSAAPASPNLTEDVPRQW